MIRLRAFEHCTSIAIQSPFATFRCTCKDIMSRLEMERIS